MAAVIKRIDLPCDVKGVIKSFYYNDMGYTYEQNEYITPCSTIYHNIYYYTEILRF